MSKRNFAIKLLITAGIFLLIVICIVYYGTENANDILSDEYDHQLSKYEDDYIQYENKLDEYNHKKELIGQYKKDSKVPVVVSVTTSQINDESIGNEIEYSYKINGNSVVSGETIEIPISSPVEFEARVEEHEAIPDIGESSSTEKITLKDLKKGFKVTQEESATETRGRDAGNTAVFKTEFSLGLADDAISEEDLAKPEENLEMPVEPVKPEIKQIDYSDIFSESQKARVYFLITAILYTLITSYFVFSFIYKTKYGKIEEKLYADYEWELEQKLQEEKDKCYKEGFDSGFKKGKRTSYVEGYKSARQSFKAYLDAFPEDAALRKNGKITVGEVTRERPYGSYTVYITGKSRGKKYHNTRGCSNATSPRYLFDIDNEYQECKICRKDYNKDVRSNHRRLYKQLQNMFSGPVPADLNKLSKWIEENKDH